MILCLWAIFFHTGSFHKVLLSVKANVKPPLENKNGEGSEERIFVLMNTGIDRYQNDLGILKPSHFI